MNALQIFKLALRYVNVTCSVSSRAKRCIVHARGRHDDANTGCYRFNNRFRGQGVCFQGGGLSLPRQLRPGAIPLVQARRVRS